MIIYKDAKLEDLVGKKIVDIRGLQKESKDVIFFMDDGEMLAFYHYQDCCEEVRLLDFDGDKDDLIGATILSAEEVSNEKDNEKNGDIYQQWTFYKIETDKGGLWMRWLGESNGYYAMDVEFSWVRTKEEIEAMTNGNVAFASFEMVRNGYANKEWARKQIERGIGDVAWAAYCMVRDGYADEEWARGQIERGIGMGNMAHAPYCMVHKGFADEEWAKGQIERGLGVDK